MQQYNSAGHVQARAMHERPEPQNRIPRFRTLAVCASSANAHALRGPRLPPHFQCGTCAEATMVQFGGASRSRCHPGGCPIRWPCRIGPLGFAATVAHGVTFRCFGCTAHTALILYSWGRSTWVGSRMHQYHNITHAGLGKAALSTRPPIRARTMDSSTVHRRVVKRGRIQGTHLWAPNETKVCTAWCC